MISVLIIGAGPAGMMAAVSAAEAGASVTLLERNPFPGKKLRITGKGRCNVTNNCSPREVVEAVTANPKFLYGAVSRFTPSDTIAFFENAGVPLKTERGRRVFPVSDKAADIQAAMVKKVRGSGVRLLCDTRVTGLTPPAEPGGTWTVLADWKGGEQRFFADRVILATGGVSYPLTGS
ncbi:MAG: NAD(P)/FAD-dependent oxidoreductase, partial [Clostridia bacterium]|nr:NAD(P)/FAD-dependent oxidoreductase [Clostridia bacterium]